MANVADGVDVKLPIYFESPSMITPSVKQRILQQQHRGTSSYSPAFIDNTTIPRTSRIRQAKV
jgi:hypothetical protein